MGLRDLLNARWPVDPGRLDRHLPDGLAPDTYDGRAWLSVVPFLNVDVRPLGVPRSLGFRFPEVNLRTYVVRDDTPDGVEDDPGVYFFNLDIDGGGIVWAARLFSRLPYYHANMRCQRDDDGRVHFRSRRMHPGAPPLDFEATYWPVGDERPREPGSLSWFLAERYRYYTPYRGSLRYADIEHPSWPLYDAEWEVSENDLFAANGFADPEGDPVLLFSPGVDSYATRNRRLH